MSAKHLVAAAVLAMLGAGLAGGSTVMAADPPRVAAEAQAGVTELPGPRLERLHRILDELHLTAGQKKQIHDILEPVRKAVEEWRQAHQADIEKVRGELKAARQAKDSQQMKAAMQDLKSLLETAPKLKDAIEQIKAVLTPEQLEKVKARLEELRERIEERRESRGATTQAN